MERSRTGADGKMSIKVHDAESVGRICGGVCNLGPSASDWPGSVMKEDSARAEKMKRCKTT